MDWAKDTYNTQYEKWVPWLEDLYLRWFTNDNKASYATKQNLGKTKVTGIDQVDNLQDGANNLAAGQVGQGGLLQPVGDLASKEGVNRAERQGKDDNGNFTPNVVSSAAEGGKNIAGTAASNVKGAGGYLGSALGGGEKQDERA